MTSQYMGDGVHVITYATHTALLHSGSGDGFLVIPDATDDVTLDSESLHAASLAHILADLEAMGWSLSDCGQERCRGRVVQGLYHAEGSTDVDVSVSAHAALADTLERV